jgi:1,4-dihydroxy-6-naphthoate synthase
MKSLRLGFSPCPNDTFMFAALATGKLAPASLALQVTLTDVEELNTLARDGVLELTKISVHAFSWVAERYALLRAGAAVGRGCGPLVVAAEPRSMDSLRGQKIAVPGRLTTANLLLQLYGKGFHRVHPVPYDAIMTRVQQGEFPAGVIIHEARFTYRSYGLHRVLDLGAWWEESQELPVPLGAILVRRDLGASVASTMEEAIRQSILYARRYPERVWPYIRSHAQEMDDAVIRQHIHLYVNDYSLDLGEEGHRAVSRLLGVAAEGKLVPPVPAGLFLDA